jgi:hypothetical protein
MSHDPSGLFHDVIQAILSEDGALPLAMRQRLLAGAPPDDALGALARKIIERAEPVDDDDIAALLAAGFSEDAVFECIVAAGIAAGLHRLERGLAALGGALR